MTMANPPIDDDEGDDEVSEDIRAAVEAEIESLRREGKALVRIEPRCRICREKPLRETVNKLLSMGLTRSAIVDVLGTINAHRAAEDQIAYHHVYRHQRRHFNASQPAQAVYEAIVARRAAEAGDDLTEGVQAAVNVFSFYETMMLKGYANLREDGTVVPYEVGAKAARELYELTRKDSGAQQVAEVLARQNRIISAIQDFVPEDKIPALIARIEGNAEDSVLDVTVVSEDDSGEDSRAYDPDDIDDDEDED